MKRDFIKFLPKEIITEIFSRVSVRTIAASKRVSKPWLQFLESDDFVKSHFAQSAPALALAKRIEDSNWLKLFELDEDELDLGSHDPLTRFAFPYNGSIQGSVNGLLFLVGLDRDVYHRHVYHHLYICNPITREFIELFRSGIIAWGFGVSGISGQQKAVCVNPRCVGEDRRFECRVNTVGTGSWRLVEATDSVLCHLDMFGAFVHGNLHWMAPNDPDSIGRISCFDLETERFSSGFTVPPLQESELGGKLYSLRDYLAFYAESPDEIAIWMMKEYGVEKSWTKEYVIDTVFGDMGIDWVDPVKVYENGDVLLLIETTFYYYSKKAKSSRDIGGLFGEGKDSKYQYMFFRSLLHTPSMVSLRKCFGRVENVIPF